MSVCPQFPSPPPFVVGTFNVLLQHPLLRYAECAPTVSVIENGTALSWRKRSETFQRTIRQAITKHNVSVLCLQEISVLWWDVDDFIPKQFHIFHMGTVAVLLRRDVFPDLSQCSARACTIGRNGTVSSTKVVFPWNSCAFRHGGTTSRRGRRSHYEADCFVVTERVTNHILSVRVPIPSLRSGRYSPDNTDHASGSSQECNQFVQITSMHLPFQTDHSATETLAREMWNTILRATAPLKPRAPAAFATPGAQPPVVHTERIAPTLVHYVIAGDFNLSPVDEKSRYERVVTSGPLHQKIRCSAAWLYDTLTRETPTRSKTRIEDMYTARGVFDGHPKIIDHILTTGTIQNVTVEPQEYTYLIPQGKNDHVPWCAGNWCSDHGLVIARVDFSNDTPVEQEEEEGAFSFEKK